jgi:hypothetical protein
MLVQGLDIESAGYGAAVLVVLPRSQESFLSLEEKKLKQPAQ